MSSSSTTSYDHDPALSGLHSFIAEQDYLHSHTKPPPPPPEITRLALQIAHNLRFQHGWTDIGVHYDTSGRPGAPKRRPMITGLPPQRVYVHPDEQIEVLNRQRREGRAGMPELGREREWVLPTHLREPWTLRRFADVFDTLESVPPDAGREDGEGKVQALFGQDAAAEPDGAPIDPTLTSGVGGSDASSPSASASASNPWRTRQPKRLLLATLDDDSTIVYYIVHDGIVKPRQN
ncbi:hypothetical protein LTR85_004188 [Meristemomyces frigidus]|nr:hypothetical protein LTR85_004188 [Meristemomyces frigidus]